MYKLIKQGFSTLVIADHANGKISKATLKVLSGAHQLKKDVSLFIACADSASVVQNAKETLPASLVKKIIIAEHPQFVAPQADALVSVLKTLIEQKSFTNIVTSTSSLAKDFLPRLAVQYGSQAITDVVSVNGDILNRPVYAGNAISSVQSLDKIRFLSFRPTNFEEISNAGEKVSDIEHIKVDVVSKVTHISDQIIKSDKPELTSARFVVSGGRGLGSRDNFKILDSLADALGSTAIGASRAAVDAGYANNDQQVGQTGKVVAPELYVAVGISGAIQHLAGMKDSKVIVAINKDAEAPIVSIADYTIVGDLFKVVPELTQKLQHLK